MSLGTAVLLAALIVAGLFGGYRALIDGRFRREPAVPESAEEPSLLADTPWVDEAGERATLLQFSSAFCAPCRATRRTLSEVVAVTPGVAHVEVDAEQHLDVVRRLGVLRTPTTLVLDAHGREVTRASGAPSKQQVLHALAAAVEA
ncbi:thioredoxin [Marmoricola sp. Leaf446]|uniref:TlpA family protein disulfide reductase n=1 Tax=Marmoricola sp. Leaf446 TaxID=1736379 RepID=UPI0006F56D58|nr:thioredoxin family protein [Marmoricola sp. Leaf446]KQT92252.1 thioredoxin [Marmoricola sp. Leaf446]